MTWSGAADALQGRMAYYKYNSNTPIAAPTPAKRSKVRLVRAKRPKHPTPTPTPTPTPKTYEFGFGTSMNDGLIGEQTVGVSTLQLSAAARDAANPVFNWIEVENRGARVCAGTMLFFRESDGVLVGDQTISLNPGARYDVGAQKFGGAWRGSALWRPSPECLDVPFHVENIRYFPNNALGVPAFASAFPVTGRYGSGRTLVAGISAESMESDVHLVNAIGDAITVHLEIEAESGALIQQHTFALAPYAGKTLRVDALLGAGHRGVVRVWSETRSSLYGDVVQIRRNSTGELNSAFSFPMLPGADSRMSSAFNTYLSQTNRAFVANSSNAPVTVRLSVIRSDGFAPINGEQVVIPARGLYIRDVTPAVGYNFYGMVTVEGPAGTTRSWVTRDRPSEFVMSTAARPE